MKTLTLIMVALLVVSTASFCQVLDALPQPTAWRFSHSFTNRNVTEFSAGLKLADTNVACMVSALNEPSTGRISVEIQISANMRHLHWFLVRFRDDLRTGVKNASLHYTLVAGAWHFNTSDLGALNEERIGNDAWMLRHSLESSTGITIAGVVTPAVGYRWLSNQEPRGWLFGLRLALREHLWLEVRYDRRQDLIRIQTRMQFDEIFSR